MLKVSPRNVAVWFVLNLICAALLVGLLSIPRCAFAQDLPASTTEELVAPSSSTAANSLLQFGYLVLVAIAGAVGLKVQALVATKAAQGNFWQVFNKLWVKAQTTVSYVEGQLRPTIQRAMEDGSLSDAEKREIADKAWEIFREKAHDELKQLPMVMQVVGDAAIEQFGRGLLERALGVLKGTATAPVTNNLMAVTPKP